jgi:hypothetical protein
MNKNKVCRKASSFELSLTPQFLNSDFNDFWQKEERKLKIQGGHKRALHSQNDTENKCSVVRTSHLHQSTEKLSKFCTHLTETRYVLRESHGRCRDNNPARTKFCAECPSDGSCGSCDSLPCTRRKWILGWVVPCEIVCEMHVSQLLQTLFSLSAEHTTSSVVG